ncbi:MAG: sigma-54-dependent Fis family transcriptional regulator [Proteobacteria bacterium]|nr:sigma-54-dependent Fis family transcriptional regulator [Pseudomonadota bacterium]
MMMTEKVLIVDDEPDIRELLEITLGRMSLATESAADLTSARRLLSTEKFSLCLTDMRLPDGDGIELVKYIQAEYKQMPVAMITAHGSTETAIKALKAGAFDFVSKPVDLQKLRDLINSALRLAHKKPLQGSTDAANTVQSGTSITGQSAAIRQLREQINKLARSQAPIYISGESGCGKELAARAIHQQSARSDAPFVAINCGAIPQNLVESELFGHLKGSFTGADKDKQGLFQAAHGGTLFLDEIADLPLQMQVKLLRVIQEKAVRPVGSQKEEAVDVRLLSATHKNLAREVELGNMRQDLFFRINVIELAVPSLRERQEDLQELTLTILNKIAKEDTTTVCEIDDEAVASLRQYSFPGNVRELENILQRAATLCEDKIIRAANLEFMNTPQAAKTVEEIHQQAIGDSGAQINDILPESSSNDIPSDFSLEKHLESIEIEAIEKALEETRWNKTAAAKKLGMSFRSLRYRLKKLGLD